MTFPISLLDALNMPSHLADRGPPVVTVLRALSDTFSAVTHGTQRGHLIIVQGVPTDMLLHLSFLESEKDQYIKVTTFLLP